MTQQPNPPLGGDEEKVEPVAWLVEPKAGGPRRAVLTRPHPDHDARLTVTPLYAASVLPVREAVKHLRKLVSVYGDMLDGNGNTPTEIRRAKRFLSTIKGDA